ncbi:DUF4357 domain-containing protein [Faunimonas sp. B44]|uniref:DUF4357 domain-containing protein n=1 Tax=Faunimonas sp. B44 TaxID=3461493 RepID=UPI00404398E8
MSGGQLIWRTQAGTHCARCLEPSADGTFYEFVRPYNFTSPSAAAAVVLDRNSNGRLEWKVVGSRLSYHQWQEENAQYSEIAEAAIHT